MKTYSLICFLYDFVLCNTLSLTELVNGTERCAIVTNSQFKFYKRLVYLCNK